MQVQVSIRLGPDETLAKGSDEVAADILSALGLDAERDTVMVQMAQFGSAGMTQMPPGAVPGMVPGA